jgi:hypothetical protein
VETKRAREVPREQTLFGDLTIFEEDKGCLEVRVARLDAGANPARVLRPMRINIDLRKRRLADGNPFLCRRV